MTELFHLKVPTDSSTFRLSLSIIVVASYYAVIGADVEIGFTAIPGGRATVGMGCVEFD